MRRWYVQYEVAVCLVESRECTLGGTAVACTCDIGGHTGALTGSVWMSYITIGTDIKRENSRARQTPEFVNQGGLLLLEFDQTCLREAVSAEG